MIRSNNPHYFYISPLTAIVCAIFIVWLNASVVLAQEQNPVEQKVQNPIQSAEEERRALRKNVPSAQTTVKAQVPFKPEEDLTVTYDEAEAQGNIVIYKGKVQLLYEDVTLIGDRATFNKATNDVTVEGNVFFEQKGQSVSAERIEFNFETKRGTVFKSTTYTDKTPDGTMLIMDAWRTNKTGEESFELENAKITACQDEVPKWSFSAKRARVRVNDRASMYNTVFRIKNIPVLYLPYVSLPISKRDRSSGLLLPTSGSSNIKGRTLHLSYYQTLGRSADLQIRTDLFSKRGVGFGFDFRARTDENSRISLGSFIVKDRILGPTRDAFGNKLPDQGGSSFYADAVQYFKNGFVAVADVNITSNFAFRQVFAENAQQAISPEERSQLYVNKNWNAYSFNVSLNEQSIFLRDKVIKTRTMPSIEFNKRSEKIADDVPIYFSFESSLEGMKRTVATNNTTDFRTPNISQRFDFSPTFTLPFKPVGGFTFTPSLALRSTYYSDSLNPITQQVVGQNLFRNYADFTLDIRPPSFAKIYRNHDGTPKFKHIIEPFATYRYISGLSDFERTIRFDERDAIANTNEIEYGIVNRFFVKRKVGEGNTEYPHEWLALTIAQQHYFDPDFGGAFVEGKRNQFAPINTISGFGFLATRRDYSPLNVNARFRPNDTTIADVRMNFDTEKTELRDISLSGTWNRKFYSLSQSWYFTRRIPLNNIRFDEATLPGNQMDTSVFAGNTSNGPYMGVTIAYDFRNQFFNGTPRDPRYVNLITTGGWAWDCCSFQFQNYTFKAGLRNENRFLFTFTLKGIGSFGTDNIGQFRKRRF